MDGQSGEMTRQECQRLLVEAHHRLGRYPKKSDFTPDQVARIKSFWGPWPRALEACGILPDRSKERENARKQKRIAAKRRRTQYKLANKQREKTI